MSSKIQSAYPDKPVEGFSQANSDESTNDADYRALFFYRNLVRENPNNTEYRYEMAKIFIKLNDYENAVSHLKVALEVDPNFHPGRILLGDCYVWMGYRDRAQTEYEQAGSKADAQGLKKAYTLAYEAGEYERAIELTAKFLEMHPEDTDARRDMAISHYMLGETEESCRVIEQNIALTESNAADFAHYGVTLNRLNKYTEAAEALEKAVALDPNNHVYAVNLANIYQTLRRPGDAEQSYRRALALNEESTAAWFNLGELLLANEQTDEAAHCFQKTAVLDPKDAEAWMLWAKASAQKNPQKALRAINKARGLGLKKDEMRYILADLQELTGNLKEATNTRRELHKDFSYDKENTYRLVGLLLKTGLPNEAVGMISQIEKIQAKDLRLFMGFAGYLRLSGLPKEELDCLHALVKTDSTFLPAKERICDIAYESGHFIQAYELGSKMNVFRSMNLRRIYVTVGQLLFCGRLEEAKKEVSALFELIKFLPDFWIKMFRLFTNYGYADVLFEQMHPYALEIGSDGAAIVGLGKVLEQAGYVAEFETICRTYLSESHHNPRVLNLLGQLMVRQKRADDAIVLLQEINRRLEDPEITVTLGEAYMQSGDIEKANGHFEAVLAKNAENYRALYGMGLLKNKAGETETALEYMTKAAEVQTSDYRILFNRGLLRMKLDQIDEGTADLSAALWLNPRSAPILSTLGTFYLKAKNYSSAKFYFLRALVVDKKNIKVWNNLAILFAQTGMESKAQKCREQVAERKAEAE